MGTKESLATKRARERGYERNSDWYCAFKQTDLTGLGHEENVNRRDPSSVLKIDGLYYTWYSKSVGPHVGFGTGDPNAKVWPWDFTEVWYATSEDGFHWTEQGVAVPRGGAGQYDDRSVFTADVLAYEGNYYLVYQCVKSPYVRRVKNTVGMSIAESPEGPWRKLESPILETSDTGQWLGEEDNRFLVVEKGDFDSHKVHDPCLFYFRDKFYLYYKGEIMGEELYMGGRETKWGVAIADHVEGPYVRSPYNPVTNSGHETCLWHYRGGLAALLTTDGMERNTIQYTTDGVNFEIMAGVKDPAPHAAGPYRTPDHDERPLKGLEWGLCHAEKDGWNYLRRYEIDEQLKNWFRKKVTYE